jgi:hypothetical protein
MLLADFINIARRIVYPRSPDLNFPRSHSKCNVSTTLPDLRHEFYALWNEIVQKAKNSNDRISVLLLKNFRHGYVRLHEGIGVPSTASSASSADGYVEDLLLSYPSCNIASHSPDQAPQDIDEAAGDVSGATATNPGTNSQFIPSIILPRPRGSIHLPSSSHRRLSPPFLTASPFQLH